MLTIIVKNEYWKRILEGPYFLVCYWKDLTLFCCWILLLEGPYFAAKI